MVHTAEISTQISKTEFERLFACGRHAVIKDSSDEKIVKNYELSDKGISWVMAFRFLLSSNEYVYQCKAKINLQRVVNNGKRTRRTFPTGDISYIDILYRNFEDYMDKLLPSKRDLGKWSLSRIDYSIDIETPYVAEYIELLKKGDKPARAEIPQNTKEKKNPENRSHWISNVKYANKSYQINIYDKYRERLAKQQERKIYDPAELEECKNILRIEVQCNKRTTNYLKKKYNMPDKEIFRFLWQDTQEKNVLLSKAKAVCRIGDYYTYKEALKLIEKSNKQAATKKQMQQVLKLINGSGGNQSIWNVENSFNGKSYRLILNKFDELCINPVTIPRRKAQNIQPPDLPLKNLNGIILEQLSLSHSKKK